MSGLRERKKRRTKQALIDAALRLFDAKGYDSTTVAEIAAAAEVSPATFFNYFATKDEVVFADDAIYLELLPQAFVDRADATPEDLLLRAIERLSTAESWSFPLDHELTRIRARLIAEVPALRAGALLRNATLQKQLAHGLRDACPEVDELTAAALTGALLGAIDAAMHAGLAAPGATSDVVRRAAEIALRGREHL
ncbi:DNA-binding transcriptional regulator, AcrR family [Saccharopolyspora antimicrobica]|uniref:DNA-binding transcriptional regulator, AcrR family n=1 Tax=Saccharopolyspora antimicrobica TaxID=455193 RepID=A0A1I4V838_9PSEU|nr:TetR/AcrR family transcriptional regulator [Saccharopolyspora antimicrobica]RKT86164.1 TetR family transcriptional regulator [Saccharopolyspora antimicrobica]SFM97333.1 DNA-binding transcriptional regulator, AcrR family [Saccharopolyspora antimicrobica]